MSTMTLYLSNVWLWSIVSEPGTGETAALVNYEKPSVPSCCSSITVLFCLSLSIFLWFFSLFYRILLIYAFEIAILCNLHFPICQRHYICPTNDLNQPFLMSVAGETAKSEAFDGPSVPSENCYLFRFCLYFWIYFSLIFLAIFSYFIGFYWFMHLELPVLEIYSPPVCQLQ